MPFTLTANSVSSKVDPLHNDPACAHCGEACGGAPILLEEKPFCCEGCKMVFEILHTNNLGTYYELESRPGISLKGREKERFAWLDDPAIVEKLLDFSDDKISKVTFQLPQIHCASCIWLLENLYKLNDGIIQSKVNFLKKEAYLTFDNDSLNLRELVELLSTIGYTPAINFSDLDETAKSKIDRTFVYQLGVAGFAFGNIMLLSFPEYLGLGESVFQKWFGYLNILLSLPVVFFSGRDYLKSAWSGIKRKALNIDVPISLGIITLFGRSVFEIITHSGAGYLDSLAGLVFFLLIGKWFQQKTYHKLSFERDYKSYFPIAAAIKKNGDEITAPLDKIKIGDVVIIRHKELIPADGVLTEGDALIDYSFVTGESDPVRKKVGDKIFAGGRQMGQTVEIMLTKNVSQSYLTQLWNEDVFQKNTNTNSLNLSDRVGKYFTFTILAIAFVTLFYWISIDSAIAINAFTAVLIIACPCAIALSIPFALGNLIRLLSRQDFYLKNTLVIEDLSSIDTIVFDKTGTITDASKSGIKYEGENLSKKEKIAIKSLVHQSTHPISRLINALYGDFEVCNVEEFNEKTGVGVSGFSNGFFIEIFKEQNGTGLKIDSVRKGGYSLSNYYRKGLVGLMENWKEKFNCFLISGDNEKEKNNLKKLFYPENLYFNQSPKDKLEFIEKLQKKGKKVMMIGDGLNDAGALRQSDVGIVVTENMNNFTPACDAILQARNFNYLPNFLNLSKAGISIVKGAYLLALMYNVIGLSYAVQGLLSPVIAAILMPLSSITIVAFGVGASNWAYYRSKFKNTH